MESPSNSLWRVYSCERLKEIVLVLPGRQDRRCTEPADDEGAPSALVLQKRPALSSSLCFPTLLYRFSFASGCGGTVSQQISS